MSDHENSPSVIQTDKSVTVSHLQLEASLKSSSGRLNVRHIQKQSLASRGFPSVCGSSLCKHGTISSARFRITRIQNCNDTRYQLCSFWIQTAMCVPVTMIIYFVSHLAREHSICLARKPDALPQGLGVLQPQCVVGP